MLFSFYDKDDFEEETFDVLYTQFSDRASIEYNSCFLFFTNGTCKMTFNTVTAQVSICWKIIYGAKQHCMQTEILLRI